MANFGNLKPVVCEIAHYDMSMFPGFKSTSYLIVKFAGESNKPYFNEMLKMAEHHMKRKTKLSVELVQQNRERDRVLFPKFIITGWNDIPDADGKMVEYTAENVNDLVNQAFALDNEFDDLREYCKDYTNFRKYADASEIAGNSSTV